MKRMTKKIIASLLAAMMVVPTVAMVGCKDDSGTGTGGGKGTYNKPGKNKTTITAVTMAAGVGGAWLTELAEGFAKEYADYEFADGKKGVYVDCSLLDKGIRDIFNNVETGSNNIVFATMGTQFTQKAANGNFLDITDIVTENREGGSIESKLFEKTAYSYKYDNKYYGLPFAEYYGGLSYNRDVFVEYNALFADETCQADYTVPYTCAKYGDIEVTFANSDYIGQAGCVLSAGPDGVKGNEDDGMPSSLEEFIVLLEYFKTGEAGIQPILLAGITQVSYANYLLGGLWSSLAGQKQMENYYSLSGQVEVVTGYTDEPLFPGVDYIKKPTTEWITLTPETGYLANDMVAKYYAYALCEILQQGDYYYGVSQGNTSNTSHTEGQSILINSSSALARSSTGFPQTAMIIDGSYWINETHEAFNFDHYYLFADTDVRPDIRWMPLPTSLTSAERETADFTAHASTLMDISHGVTVIDARIQSNPEIMEACKKFVSYVYREENLKKYTISSRQFMGLNYEFSDEELNQLDPFYQSLWKLRDNKQASNIVYALPKSDTSEEAFSVFRRAIHTISIDLQSEMFKDSILRQQSCYFVLNRPDNVLEDNGLYKYGSKYLFENTKLDAATWARFI